jgi:hypothetical protein
VETDDEACTLTDPGVEFGQGYLWERRVSRDVGGPSGRLTQWATCNDHWSFPELPGRRMSPHLDFGLIVPPPSASTVKDVVISRECRARRWVELAEWPRQEQLAEQPRELLALVGVEAA